MLPLIRKLIQYVYPDMRHKDAACLATVLSDYASFSPQQRRAGLANFDEIETCYWSLRLNRRIDARSLRRLTRGAGAPEMDQPQGLSPASIERRYVLSTGSYLRQLFQVEKAMLELQSLPQIVARTPIMVERFCRPAGDMADSLKRRYDQELSDDRPEKIWRLVRRSSRTKRWRWPHSGCGAGDGTQWRGLAVRQAGDAIRRHPMVDRRPRCAKSYF